jgi:hypothetical protein
MGEIAINTKICWKPERKTPSGRPRRTWKVNVEIDLGERGCDSVVSIHVNKDRVL